jgi:hypothetical protein
MTGRDLSKVIVTKYVASYRRDPVTQSACDLTKSAALAEAIRRLAGALKSKLKDSKVRQGLLNARAKAQSYEVRDNIDLVDFCSLLSKALAGTEIAQRCQDVIRVVKSGYVVSQACKGTSLKNSHGVAVYFPTQSVSPLYASLDFAKKTGWGTFLKAYLTAVRHR